MTIDEFKKEFKKLNSFRFGDIILFKDEVYDTVSEESKEYKELEEILDYKINDKTLKEHIESLERIEFRFEGGRGSTSGESKSLFGGQGGDGNATDKTTYDLPSRMNRLYNGNKQSQDNTVGVFEKEHLNSKIEHAVIYDDDGFVSTYKHGNAGSVSFNSRELNGKHVIHNHPTNGHPNFSKGDLDTWSSTGLKGITATSSKGRFTVTKGQKFDAKGFQKALNSAKTSLGDYDKAVDRWLKSNQKKYGYTYKGSWR